METVSTHSNEFYVTLPSNASTNFFPANKPHEYKIRLAHPIQLRGNWEVGLAEILYPKVFNTLDRPLAFCYLHVDDSNFATDGEVLDFGQIDNPDRQFHYVEIPAGHYQNPQDLVNAIMEKLKGTPVEDQLLLRWSRANGKLHVTLGERVRIKWQD